MAKSKKTNTKTDKTPDSKPVVAKQDDGSIQITFNISWKTIEENKNKALKYLGESIEIPGFRKGKAPIEKVEASVSREKLIQQTLSTLLPKFFNETIVSEKIRPAVYPKFELVKANDNEDWEVRAITCEIPPFELGNYKDIIKKELSTEKIWTPDKVGQTDEQKSMTRQQKEQKLIEVLLKVVVFTVPSVLVDEEVNSRLSRLLEQTEKLGLTLDSYLASIGKTPQSIRDEYKVQSESSIRLELILEKIAISENIKVEDSEVEAAIAASKSDPNLKDRSETPEQISMIKVILQRRKALDFLISLF